MIAPRDLTDAALEYERRLMKARLIALNDEAQRRIFREKETMG